MYSKYGDLDNVKNDLRTLNDILERQGSQFLLDVIAEQSGHIANRFNYMTSDRSRLLNSLVKSFKEALLERL